MLSDICFRYLLNIQRNKNEKRNKQLRSNYLGNDFNYLIENTSNVQQGLDIPSCSKTNNVVVHEQQIITPADTINNNFDQCGTSSIINQSDNNMFSNCAQQTSEISVKNFDQFPLANQIVATTENEEENGIVLQLDNLNTVQKTIDEMNNKFDEEITKINVKLDQILKLLEKERSSTYVNQNNKIDIKILEEMKFPIKTTDDVNKLEIKLEDDNFKNALVIKSN